MEVFQTSMNTVLKSLLRLAELHLALHDQANLKILNAEQLSKSPFIADELALARADLQPLKHELETASEQAKQAIERCLTLPDHRPQQRAIVSRMVTRSLEAVDSSPCEHELEYYRYYNDRFRTKCRRILSEVAHWEPFEVARVVYKYFRHVALIELERYEEILECLAQTDFDSLKHFREYFYNMLQKKESKQRGEHKVEQPLDKVSPSHAEEPITYTQEYTSASSPNIPAEPGSLQTIPHDNRQLHSQKAIHHPPNLFQSQKSEGFSQKQSEIQVETAPLPPPPTRSQSPGKAKANLKSTKKLFSMLSSVMDIKREHFVSDASDRRWEERSLYSDLVGRNRGNQGQIEAYYHYSQLMAERRHPADTFYYPQDEPEEPEEPPATEKKRVKVVIPREEQEKLFTCVPTRKQPSPQLTNPVKKPNSSQRPVHRSIDCRPKNDFNPEHKPLKLNNQFISIDLRKVLPTRRQSQMEQMVSRASSLNSLRHDLHHKKVQETTEKALKANSEVFKSVKILHQGEVDHKQEVKTLREVKEKADRPHHNRINSRIDEELRKDEYYSSKPEEVRKRMALNRLEQ